MRDLKTFALDASIITAMCVGLTLIFYVFGASKSDATEVFTFAVMTSAVIYPAIDKPLKQIFVSAIIMSISIILGRLFGEFGWVGIVVGIAYNACTFYFPKNRTAMNVWATSSMMFIVFLSLPTPLQTSLKYVTFALITSIAMTAAYFVLRLFRKPAALPKEPRLTHPKTRAIITTISLAIAFGVDRIIHQYVSLPHVYWIELTIVLVLLGADMGILKSSIKRVGINAVGAFISIVLFSYLITGYWSSFIVLIVFLFCIFFLGFNYFTRVLFIELFVLCLAQAFGNFTNFLAADRLLLTATGAVIVIAVTLAVKAVDHYCFKGRVMD